MESKSIRRKKNISLWGPVGIWMGIIFGLSSISQVPVIGSFNVSDKLLHAIAYGILGGLTWRALDNRKPKWFRLLATIAIAAAYGYSDEFHQRFVPGRCYDMLDLAADAVGASAVAACAMGLEVMVNRGKK